MTQLRELGTQSFREVKDVLAHAVVLAEGGRKWTQGCIARNFDGMAVNARDEDACRFCAIGLLDRATMELFGDRRREEQEILTNRAQSMIEDKLPRLKEGSGLGIGLGSWNDVSFREWSEVEAKLKEAAR